MKKSFFLLLLLAVLFFTVKAQNPADYVNPFIGTNGMGHTFPGACYPYGAVQLSPDTDTVPHNINGVYQPHAYDYCAGYQHRDKTIVGFSHTHFSGTGHSDLGDILIMPYSGETKLNPGTADNPDAGYRQRYRHETVVAYPGYYDVTLDDDNIRCELTASPLCGVHRYTYQPGADQKVIVDLNHAIYNYDGKVLWAQCNVKDPYTLVGYRITNGWSRTNYIYFAITFNKKIKQYGCKDFFVNGYKGFWNRFDTEHDFPEMGGRKLVTWFEFEDDGSDVLEIVVALSATSMEGALSNLGAFTDSYSDGGLFFDSCLKSTEKEWQKRLSNFEVVGSVDAKTMLYTSLYHTLINPSLYQDYNGDYRGVDQNIHHNPSVQKHNYTVFSLWDTYRAFHPLITLLDENLTKDVIFSFLRHAEQSPHHILPVWSHNGSENWCMIGYHGVSVLADALQKGYIQGEEAGVALGAMSRSANTSYYSNTDKYLELGFVPVELNPSGTSVTLENAYEDWTIYHTILQMKQQYPELHLTDSLAEYYRQRALSYRNVFDTEEGYVRARHADGSWKTPYSLLSTSGEGLIEGNSLNYSFYVPHDVNGMMALMGGEKKFVEKLDHLFTMYLPDEFFAETEDVTREGMLGGYVQGNEPSHHIPYLYMWTGQPWKTQYWLREIMNKMYRNHIDGLCGNDDCGQMSAWYIFTAMGFYPVCPGSGEYVLGAPYLPYMKVTLGNGKTLEIKAPKVSDENRYVQKVLWNGQAWDKCYVTHEMLMRGGVLEFEMGAKPNKKLFQKREGKPYSM